MLLEVGKIRLAYARFGCTAGCSLEMAGILGSYAFLESRCQIRRGSWFSKADQPVGLI